MIAKWLNSDTSAPILGLNRKLEKAIMMDKSNAMNAIMTVLNEDGLMVPGSRAHGIVTEYMNFKIDRMGPEEALEDVLHTKEHLV